MSLSSSHNDFSSALARALKRSRKSRERIADELTLKLGIQITVRMLNYWAAPSREDHRFPAAYLPALCDVLGEDRLLRHILKGTRLEKLVALADAELLSDAASSMAADARKALK